MATEKRLNQEDVYLPMSEIAKRFSIPRKLVYSLFNKKKVKYIFKELPFFWRICKIIHFNINDVWKKYKDKATTEDNKTL